MFSAILILVILQVDKLKVQISDVEKAKDNLEVANHQLEADKKNLEKKLSKAQSNLDTAKNHITDLMTELKKVGFSVFGKVF